MALTIDYEIPSTGLVVPNAYHVITHVKVEKRMQDLLPPADSGSLTGFTETDRGPEVYWKAGYIGTITVHIWTTKEARDTGKEPIGTAGVNPGEARHGCCIGTPGLDHKCMFMIDENSTDNYLTQAYAHLRTTEFYSWSVAD